MREDILRHMSNVITAVEELIDTYSKIGDNKKIEIDVRLEEKIKNLHDVVKWSKND